MDKPYCRIQHEQGSLEWHHWRKGGIGASDAPVIMGENRFKSVGELLREKRAPAGGGRMNAAMARGVELEPAARSSYCTRFDRIVEAACLQSITRGWMRASVDGFSECGSHLVEIKCGQSVYRHVASTGRPPIYYYGQLQHALAVTGLDAMDFWCFLPHLQPLHIVIKRDEPYIARLIDAEQKFYETHLSIGSVDSLEDLQ